MNLELKILNKKYQKIITNFSDFKKKYKEKYENKMKENIKEILELKEKSNKDEKQIEFLKNENINLKLLKQNNAENLKISQEINCNKEEFRKNEEIVILKKKINSMKKLLMKFLEDFKSLKKYNFKQEILNLNHFVNEKINFVKITINDDDNFKKNFKNQFMEVKNDYNVLKNYYIEV